MGCNKLTIVKVATANQTKVDAVKKAFTHFFPELQVISCKVESGVAEQPINEEVYKGAENRIKEAKKIKVDYNYIVSCEGGLVQLFGKWFNMQIVIVEDQKGKRSIGLSQSYQIPERYVSKIIQTSIATVFDELFSGRGGIRELTQNNVTREDLVKDATMMAISGIINQTVW